MSKESKSHSINWRQSESPSLGELMVECGECTSECYAAETLITVWQQG